MPHWTLDQHFEVFENRGIRQLARLGEGTRSNPIVDPRGCWIERDCHRERSAIEGYLQSESSAHRALIQSMAEGMPAMHSECRMVVLLPCRNESQHIEDRLNLLAEQFRPDASLLARNEYEVIVLVNTCHDEPKDPTMDMVKRWVHPAGMTLHSLEFEHAPNEMSPLTLARKILADLALLRALRRGAYEMPLYLCSEDADVVWNDPRQLFEMIKTLDEHPELDALRGYQDRCPWLLIQHPILMLMRRSWNFCESYAASRPLRPGRNPNYHFNWNRHVTSGWNTAFSAEVYANIGGYNRDRQFEEDLDIGEKISALRAYEVSGNWIPQVNTIASIPIRAEASPRRWYYRAAKGIEPYEDTNGYENFFGKEHERVLKSQPLGYLSSLIAPSTQLDRANIPLLEGMLQKDLDFLVRLHGDPKQAQMAYQRILRWLGFTDDQAFVCQGRVVVESLAGVAQAIQRLAVRIPEEPVAPWKQSRSALRRSCPGQSNLLSS